ncbi:MAG: WYL domain-containing protein [Ilumatobacteraceae bacterium]
MASTRRGPTPAHERLRRLLVMLPWIMERQEVPVAEIAERFGISEQSVLADLERASMCGLPPFGPEDLIDLFVDDGVVYAGLPRIFTRPLRLSAPEGFALLTTGRAALQLPGADPDGALARALDKLAVKLGDVGVEIDLQRPATVDEIAEAVAGGHRLRIEYWSGRRDASTSREIDPLVVFVDRGFWYTLADDHLSGEERVFRIDRIERVERTGARFEGRDVVPPTETGWFAGDDLPRVTLRLDPAQRWIVERYPADSVDTDESGAMLVTMPVTSEAWLARLLLRAGPTARVVAPAEFQTLASRTAARVLDVYRTD